MPKEIEKEWIDGDPGPNPWVPQIETLQADVGLVDNKEINDFIEKWKGHRGPASGKYHSNRIWGLWEHLYQELRVAIALNNMLGLGYTARDIFTTILGHDGEKFMYPPQPNYGKSGQLLKDMWGYNSDEDAVREYLPHPENCIKFAREHFNLTDYQEQAIIYHMGPWGKDINTVPWMKADILCDFTKFIIICDYLVSQLVEDVFFLKR